MPTWLPVRALLYFALAIAAAFALWALWGAIRANPKAEARLARNQAQAAAESGSDAANTVGAASEREAASDALTRSNEQEIRNAEGADAVVAAPVRDAGLASLCKRRAYHGDPRCVQHANPR